MSVRKLFLSASLVSVFVAGSLILTFAQGKDDDPFFDHGPKGETIKVLPAPAQLKSQNPNGPSFAAPSDEAQVFAASYGRGNLVDHGGLEIANARFVPIFWNQQVAQTTETPGGVELQTYIDGFITSFGSQTSHYADTATADFSIVQQYGSHATIAPGIIPGIPWVDGINGAPASQTLTDADVQTYLATIFTRGGGPSIDDNTIYGVYFPAGTTVKLGGSSCSSFCGYHSHFTFGAHQIKYAVFPYLNCTACKLSTLTVGDMLTIVTSHEIREAVTDPGDANINAWYDQRGYEADDKCAWHNLYPTSNGGYMVQPEYSNGGTVTRSGFTATYPGPGCIVPSTPTGGGGGGGGNGHGHGHLTTNGRGGGGR
jgi:hypothetical protein